MNWYLTSVLEKLSLGVLWIFPRAARAVSWIENNYPAFLATSELVPEQSGSDTGRPYEGPVGAPLPSADLTDALGPLYLLRLLFCKAYLFPQAYQLLWTPQTPQQ